MSIECSDAAARKQALAFRAVLAPIFEAMKEKMRNL
jgi:hypothetical protein